jgi:hypothetical protein
MGGFEGDSNFWKSTMPNLGGIYIGCNKLLTAIIYFCASARICLSIVGSPPNEFDIHKRCSFKLSKLTVIHVLNRNLDLYNVVQ